VAATTSTNTTSTRRISANPPHRAREAQRFDALDIDPPAFP
jgi:hypothetical protein